MIQTYNILSLLLDYPTEELQAHLDEARDIVAKEGVIDATAMSWLDEFLAYVHGFASLLDWQSAYSSLFDTGGKASLYLFDFVYGTDRDRGQAMVDLKEEYLRAGLMPQEEELPDFLPVYLQYVAAFEDRAEARRALADVGGVLAKMQELFAKEQHPYLSLIKILQS